MIGEFNKKSQYKLLKSPVNFKKEFKFYFVEIDVQPKDSTSVGVTNNLILHLVKKHHQ